MVSFINSRTGVTGVIYLETYRPIQLYFGTCIQWREAGVIERVMTKLHEQVREEAKTPQNGQPY